MNIYITTGTVDFLKKLKDKYSKEKLYLMENNQQALLLHETLGKTFFATPRKYEVVDQRGELAELGYVVMNNIPVTEEGRPGFEYRFKNRAGLIEKEPGFVALKILRPIKNDTYIILTQWQDEAAFSNWKNSSSFQSAHKNGTPADENPGLNQKIFSGPAFVTQYSLVSKEL